MRSSERWQEVKEILYSALEIEPEKRASFLDEKCGDDMELRREVESLMAANEEADGHFESPAVEVMAETVMNSYKTDLIGQSLGNYQIIERLGSGGMGEVYLARDKRLDRKAAIKLIPEGFASNNQTKQRFTQEAKAASALNHPNIITIYEIASDRGFDFIAMEHVEGETVREVLERGRVDTRKAVELSAQTASGLAAAHEAGIIHRDIKPENLMVTRTAQIKILDFGLAKLVEHQRPALAHSNLPTAQFDHASERVETLPGTILGTVAYMSPEQAEGRPLDRRTDIFSLGVVFYEMITGRRAFDGKSAIDTLHSIINSEPRPARELNLQLPLEVEDLLAKTLAKEPSERYQHAGDFELDLRRFKRALESGSLMSTRVSAPMEMGGKSSSLAWWAVGGAVLLTASLLGIYFFSRTTSVRAPATVASTTLSKATLAPLTVDPGFEGEPTFAPDGQTIAYVSDRTGNFEIFLRQISGGPDINLTNNAADDMQPSISPDGKQIAFVSSRSGQSDCLCFFIYGTDQPLMGGSIWVMPTFGGNARKIVEMGTFPSWAPDGSSLVFTKGPWYGQSIYRVASNGGEAQEIVVNLKESAPFLAYPTYSPDGNQILFEAGNKIFIVNSAGGDAALLVEGKHPVWSYDGSSIYYTNVEAGKNYTLWQAPIREAKLAGEPSPLTVGRGRDTQAAVSRDGNFVAFSALDVSFNLETIPFDAETAKVLNQPRPITSGSDLIYFFSTAANSETAVFDSHRGSSSFIWKVDGTAPSVQLTSDPKFDDNFPEVSPDGRTIAFNRHASGQTEAPDDLWFMEADGANPRLIIEKACCAGWMPDGRAFIYFSMQDGQLYLYDLPSRSTKQLTNEEGVYAKGTPSPDGKWVVFMSIATGNIDVKAVPIDGGESIAVVGTPRQDFHPFFSRSGQWLYFQLDHKNLYRVPGPAQAWRKADPEKVTNFPESGLFLEDPDISSDGRQLMCSRRRTHGDIWLLNLNR